MASWRRRHWRITGLCLPRPPQTLFRLNWASCRPWLPVPPQQARVSMPVLVPNTQKRPHPVSRTRRQQGSSLSASAMSINADKANIIGSDINAGLLALDATDILIGAGTNEQAAVTNKKPRLPASVSVAAGRVAGMPMSVLMKRTPKSGYPVR